MDETTHSDTKSDARAALIALVERGQVEEEAFRAGLSAEERAQVGTAEQWAPKEVIAHLGYWKQRQVERITAHARGETSPETADFQTLNTESWPEHARLTWEESVARSDQGTQALIAALDALPASFTPGAAAADQADQADLLASTTLGNSLGHVGAHISDYWVSHGDMERARRTQQEIVAAIIAARLGDAQEGSARYNLACYYALHGQLADALTELRPALALRPDLISWAREDHDLDSLRADPAFQALVPPTAPAPPEDA